MKKLPLKTQFRLGAGLILFLFCLGTSLLVYNYQKSHVEETVYKETEIYIAAVDATRTYVKDVLRPKMYELLPEDQFVVEGMSTSFVGREVMKRVHDRLPEFSYKRAASNPINPINKADSFEAKMIDWFKGESNQHEWSGIIQKNGRAYYTRLRAIYAESDCLRCHGDPKDAPKALLARYNPSGGGFGYRVGEVVAADAIYIPVDSAFARIKKQTWMTFFSAIGLLLASTIIFYSLFNHIVISKLEGLLSTFKGILDKSIEPEDLEPHSHHYSADEIGQLTAAFENVASDLKRTHEELIESESKFRRLFETSRDANFIWDMDKKIVDMNEAGVRMFEFKDRTEALSIKSIGHLFWDVRDCNSLLESIEQNGFAKEAEASMVTKRSAKRLDVLVTANLRYDESGNPNGFEGVLRDVTEKKQFEKYLAQTEKLASLGQLAAGVAHEINNPLTVIKCYSDLIKKNVEEGSQICGDVEIIEKHTQNCKTIVEALLNFARLTETKITRADLHEGLEEVLSILEEHLSEPQISLRRNYAKDIPQTTIDTEKMKQVYMNLLMNAGQAISGAGEVTITTVFDREKNTVLIKIADTGCGIPPDRINVIFDPFFTAKKTGKGTGLGLSISYGIVKEHGGEILVESSVGKGSVFTIVLPIK
jgi:two-component system, NtrC family, sensor kinase